jgi:4a-hydroxytetrahydrobiopterin dehydratase
MVLLNEDAIEQELKALNIEWGVIGGATLTRVFKFDDFKQALDFTNQVGKLAEEMNHHPEINLAWGKVEIQISTHSEGGITENDFLLAAKIDSL